MNDTATQSTGKCPVMHGGVTSATMASKDWWPKALNLDIRIRPAADTFHDMTEAVTLREKPIAECGDETSGARNKPGAVAGRD